MDCIQSKGVPIPRNNEFEPNSLEHIYRGIVDIDSYKHLEKIKKYMFIPITTTNKVNNSSQESLITPSPSIK